MHGKASAALDVSENRKKKIRLVTWVCRSFPQPAARHGGAQGRCTGLCAETRHPPPGSAPRGCRSVGAAARARGPLRRARGGVVQRVWGRRACRRVRQAAGCRSAAACCRDRPAGEMQARGAWAIPPDCKHRPPSNSWLPRGASRRRQRQGARAGRRAARRRLSPARARVRASAGTAGRACAVYAINVLTPVLPAHPSRPILVVCGPTRTARWGPVTRSHS